MNFLENHDLSQLSVHSFFEKMCLIVENTKDMSNVESEEESKKKQKSDDDNDDYDSEAADELSLLLHDSDTEEECSSLMAKIPKIVLSEAEKRCEKNIQERKRLWERTCLIFSENMSTQHLQHLHITLPYDLIHLYYSQLSSYLLFLFNTY